MIGVEEILMGLVADGKCRRCSVGCMGEVKEKERHVTGTTVEQLRGDGSSRDYARRHGGVNRGYNE